MKLRACLHRFIYSISVFIIIIAVVIGLSRLMLSSLHLLHQSIETAASDILQQPVKLGSIAGKWQGLYPELILNDVQLLDPEVKHPFFIKRLELSIDWPSSVSKRTLQLNSLTIIGMNALVERDAGDVVRIHGIIPQQSSFDVVGSIFSLPEMHFQDTTLHWKDDRLDLISLSNADFSIYNQDDSHQLSISLQPNKDIASSVRVLMDLTGSLEASDSWLGNVYVEAEDFRPFSLLDSDSKEDQIILSRHLSAWGSIQGGRLMRVFGQGLDEKGDISGVFQWLNQGDSWHVDVNGFDPAQVDSSFSEYGMSLQASTDGQDEIHYLLGMKAIDTSWLMRLLLAANSQSVEFAGLIQGLSPQGAIDYLQVDMVTTKNNNLQSFDIDAQLNDFSVHSWNDIPGVDGLSLQLKGDMSAGVVSIKSDGAHFNAPNLFRWPLALDRVVGGLSWSYQEDGLLLQTTGFEVGNAHLQTESYIKLQIPLEGGSPHLDMQMHFSEGDIAHVEPYLPAKIMPPAAVEWLDAALVGGRITQGGMLFYGYLQDFPFAQNQGRFEVRFDIEESLLDYKQGWESIHALQAEVVFLNQSMEIYADKGEIFNVGLSDVVVSIEDLSQAHLIVKGHANGSFSSMMRFVKESPVGGSYASGIGEFDGTGDSHLALHLEIPLASETDKTIVDGFVDLDANSVLFPEWNMSLDKLKGRFSFDGSALYSNNMKASLFGDPVQINMDAIHQGQDIFTRIDISGKVDLLARLPSQAALLSTYINGVSDWLLRMNIPTSAQDQNRSTDVSLSSTLQGLSINLPEPLTKNRNESRVLMLNTQLSVSGESKIINFLYDDVLSGVLELSDKKSALWWNRIAINLGKGTTDLSDTHDIMISGQMDYLDINDWLMVLDKEKEKESLSGEVGSLFVDLALRDLRLSKYSFNDTQVMIDTNHARDIVLSGDDLSGVIKFPGLIDKEQPITIALDRLALKVEGEEDNQSITSDLQPEDVPAIDIYIEKLYIKDLLLGKFQGLLRPHDNELAIDDIQLTANLLNIEGKGIWSTQGNIEKTTLSIVMHDSSLDNLLHLFSIEDYVDNGDVDANLELFWDDTPYNFSMDTVNGELDLLVSKGRLLNVDAGAGKILGLLNFNAIPKRFTLDFDDFLQGGFAFDRMKGRFTIWNGNAYTNNFVVDSSMAGIQVFGRTGLYDQDYDLTVMVSPHLSSSLPLLGMLAGGPGVGAALYLADKLFSSPFSNLNKLADSEYLVTGNWSHPKVIQVKKKAEEKKVVPARTH